ncbi:MAG: acyltransferase [Leptospiraceae bacterium]|nr:acyltransferase [Leptospiraceae bacterium]MDW8306322.1 acyltransferase [Leptospiraceae bacterium]
MTLRQSQILRFWSMLAVIVIHATGHDEIVFQKTHNYFSLEFLSVILNQLSRFCVPLFVFLSGYALSEKYQKTFSLADFIKDRFMKIVLPFIFITILSLIMHKKWSLAQSIKENLSIFLRALTIEQADYHLYFFVIIIQCYFFFPLLRKVNSYFLLGILLMPNLLLYFPGYLLLQSLNALPPNWPSAFFPYWLFYFYGGIFYSSRKNEIELWLKKIPTVTLLLLTLIVFSLLLVEYCYRSYENSEPGYYNHFHRLSVLSYCVLFLALFRQFPKSHTNESRYSDFMEKTANLSFFIYLFHPSVLRLVEFLSLPGLILIPVVFMLTYLWARLTDFLLPTKPQLLRLCLGLPVKKLQANPLPGKS